METTNFQPIVDPLRLKVDLFEAVLDAVVHLSPVKEKDLIHAVKKHRAAKYSSTKEILAELVSLRQNHYAYQVGWKKWQVTDRGISHSQRDLCDRCGSRGWCSCHD